MYPLTFGVVFLWLLEAYIIRRSLGRKSWLETMVTSGVVLLTIFWLYPDIDVNQRIVESMIFSSLYFGVLFLAYLTWPKGNLGHAENLDGEKARFRRAISDEFAGIIQSLIPVGQTIVPFHLDHITYSIWHTKDENTRATSLGEGYSFIESFYGRVDYWNEFMANFPDPPGIYREVGALVKQARIVFNNVPWISSSHRGLEKILLRLEKRFAHETNTAGVQEAMNAV